MRRITTTSGTPVDLDGDADLLAIFEVVSRDLTRTKDLDYDYQDFAREFEHLVAQMNEAELRAYLKESFIMDFQRFENDRMLRVLRKARDAREPESRG